jgi:hypothetical protein
MIHVWRLCVAFGFNIVLVFVSQPYLKTSVWGTIETQNGYSR